MDLQPIDFDWIGRNVSNIAGYLGSHLVLSIVPVVIAFVISLPLGYLISRSGKVSNVLLAILGLLYAIPSLALFVLLPLVLPTSVLSPVNIVTALTIYTLALLVRSVVDGFRSVPELVKQSASAVGYSDARRVLVIELPLAMPVIFAGLRVATVSNIALVSVAVLVGQQSLGTLFDSGFNVGFQTPVWVGTVLAIVVALLADGLILLLQRSTLPWRQAVRA